ncbi:ATP-binding protein [Nonomuraea longicatena]|uniref:ATP-binding protein n=1 Tax=Nonomuraea longicatena TaxID=83682 RepID=UPI0031D478FC
MDEWQRLAAVTLPGVERSVPVARRCAAAALSAYPETTCDVTLLLLSELVTNAVQHSSSGGPNGEFTFELHEVGDRLNVAVRDQGTSTSVPVMRRSGENDDNGRGLVTVAALAASWGVRWSEAGCVVWFEIVPEDRASARATADARPCLM